MGADAARCNGDRGTITVGKYADLVLLSTDRIGFAPFGSLADRVVNFASTSDIDSVWVRGVARKRKGRLVGIDVATLKAAVFHARQRVQKDAEMIKLV